MKKLSTTSDDILASARNLIVAGGYNGFSYADIAEVVGIRKASIHHHFPAKADLVRTLVAGYREGARAGIAEMERSIPQPIDQLRAYVAYWTKCIGDGTAPFCVCALLASELPIVPDDVAAEVKGFFRTLSTWLASVLERGAQLGEIRLASSPQVEADAFMATVHGAMLSARAFGDPTLFETIMTPQLQRLAAPR
ncbi:TetR family transcriptional regulator [Pseudoduganella lurida]|uniref:TetR family transcriptional regulator n=1 Tax=Pseudoduganella lurida TaxID=1036180 RepID=A0A562RKK3_9BURK|nr:TetR/AcrR family transcriptional regulator [Pseudoduganella lurida]TWI69569.1 TetR family transcriptional regulator [Pseudoduganella lurida]